MRRRFIYSLVFVAVLSSSAWAASPAPVSVTQLQVRKKVSEALSVNLFPTEGVQFVAVVSLPDRNIVGVVEDASKLISATDDKGTDLAEDSSEKWISSFFSLISGNNHKVAIPVTLKTLPAAGATAIQVKGSIVLRCGSEEKTETIQSFDLAKGTTAKCGTHTIAIASGKSFGGSMFGGKDDTKQQTLSMTLDESGHWLKKYEFIDDKGTVIKSKSGGSSGGGDSITYDVEIPSDVKAAGLRVTYFQKVEDVTQPIDLKIGVGLP